MTDEPARLKYIDRAKTGQIYFRMNGKRLARLPDDQSSAEFAAEYDYLMNEHAGKPRIAKPVGDIADLKRLIPGEGAFTHPR